LCVHYNDNDPQICAWLRELMADGLIPKGAVDERDIREICGAELKGFRQVHLFAGIGGWPYALRLAGWPDHEAVWTGSCPCQAFSAAGKRKGEADERHLWPAFRRLIAECRPPTVFGEQVASRLGREWLAGVRSDLEALGYAVGAADLPAACVGAPHIRQRLFWVADNYCERRNWQPICVQQRRSQQACVEVARSGNAGGLADTQHPQPGLRESGEQGQARRRRHRLTDDGEAGGLADPLGPGLAGWTEQSARDKCKATQRGGPVGRVAERPEAVWADFNIAWCRSPMGGSPRPRRFKPGAFPLPERLPGRVALLRGAGNAIVPQAAAEFIKAYIATTGG